MRPLHLYGPLTLLLLSGISAPALAAGASRQESVPQGLARAVDAARREVRSEGNGFFAHHPGQRLVANFDGTGWNLWPEGGAWNWGLELRAFGRVGRMTSLEKPRGVQAAGTRVRYDWSPNLHEWFDNQAAGIEHGLDLARRPGGRRPTGDPLRFVWEIEGGLAARVDPAGRAVSFVDEQGQSRLEYRKLLVTDADGIELEASYTARNGQLVLSILDEDARYPIHVDPIAQQAYLKASNAESSDFFGFSVAIDGNTAVVGAIGEASAVGGVGGDPTNNTRGFAGAAYVFVRSGSTWVEEAYLKASSPDASDFFGNAVAIDGDLIVVGAPGEDGSSSGVGGDPTTNGSTDSGAAYVFARSGGTWHEEVYLKPAATSPGDSFGTAVAVSGATVVVGAPGEDSGARGVNGDPSDDSSLESGAAFVFVRNGSVWLQQAFLKSSNSDRDDRFGQSVAIEGDTVLVGAPGEDSSASGVGGQRFDESAPGSGAAYVFQRGAGVWSEQTYLKATNTGAQDHFGSPLALSRDRAVIAAVGEDSVFGGSQPDPSDDSGVSAGAVYVYVRSGSAWSPEAYLKASNPDSRDEFGTSVAIEGDRLLVGTPYEASAATGIGGDEADNSALHAGAAYLFERTATGWFQRAYIKASNTDPLDGFGSGVGLTDEVFLVGALGERGGSRGIGGDPSDNSAPGAGAAYAFTLPPFALSSEVVRLGTPANPAALLPGQTSGPVLGATWDPRVDHTAFAPGASLDVLVIDARGPINVPTRAGTLLCRIPGARQIFAVASGNSFQVAIPNDCSLIGRRACAQAAAVGGAGGVELTNALDLVVGSM